MFREMCRRILGFWPCCWGPPTPPSPGALLNGWLRGGHPPGASSTETCSNGGVQKNPPVDMENTSRETSLVWSKKPNIWKHGLFEQILFQTCPNLPRRTFLFKTSILFKQLGSPDFKRGLGAVWADVGPHRWNTKPSRNTDVHEHRAICEHPFLGPLWFFFASFGRFGLFGPLGGSLGLSGRFGAGPKSCVGMG